MKGVRDMLLLCTIVPAARLEGLDCAGQQHYCCCAAAIV